MREMMIDIETLGTRNTSVILQVGLLVFEEDEIIQAYLANLNIEDQIRNYNRTMDGDTILWWLKQKPEAQASVTDERLLDATNHVLYSIQKLSEEYTVKEFWAKGGFDFDILETLFQSANMKPSWNFRTRNDMRPLLKLYPAAKHLEREEKELAHSAVGDCMYQLRQLQLVRQRFEKGLNL